MAIVRYLVLLLAALASVTSAWAVDCASGVLPYQVSQYGITTYGNTAAEACTAYAQAMRTANSWTGTTTGTVISATVCRVSDNGNLYDRALSGPNCTLGPGPNIFYNVTTCSSACTVTHVLGTITSSLSPGTVSFSMPAFGSSQVGDYMELWALFLVAGVLVLCAKAIYNRFRIDEHGN